MIYLVQKPRGLNHDHIKLTTHQPRFIGKLESPNVQPQVDLYDKYE